MNTITTRWLVFLVLLAVCESSMAKEPLSREEVGKLGRAATAYVQLKSGKGSASAFCISPEGLFVTNYHVIRSAPNESVDIVLNSGSDDPKVLKGKVLRSDPAVDLAILRVEGEHKLPVLELGSDAQLSELTEVVAFGFPFGNRLAAEKDDYPSISINVGNVTALRQRKGKLTAIQLDAALNPGNSGGPVLSRDGKVVGVVAAGVPGSGVNFAVPVSQLTKLISEPEITFIAPAVTYATRHEPVTFEARAVVMAHQSEALHLQLVLTHDGKERKFDMELADGVYRAKAVPVDPAQQERARLHLTATYDQGFVSGLVRDQVFKIDGKEVELSAVRSVASRPKAEVTFNDGHAITGSISGLEAVLIDLGNVEISLDLTKAAMARIMSSHDSNAVTCTVVATRQGVEIKRVSQTISLINPARAAESLSARAAMMKGAVPAKSIDAAKGGEQRVTTESPAGISAPLPAEPVDIHAPDLEEDKVVKRLPSNFSDVAVGGGGRYLILYMSRERKLAVFDVNSADFVDYIPLTEDNVKFAAGIDRLIIVCPGSKTIQRWNLATFKRELTTTLPIENEVHAIAMGAASTGPLLLTQIDKIGRAEPVLLDIQSMQPLSIQNEKSYHGFWGHKGQMVRASADGSMFTTWSAAVSPQGIFTLVLEGTRATEFWEHDSAGHLTPGPDGKTLFTARGLFTNQGKRLPDDGLQKGYCVPACHGPYYLVLDTSDPFRHNTTKEAPKVSVYLLEQSRPLITLSNIELPQDVNGWDRETMSGDKRIYFMPDANLIVTLPTSNDRLILHRFDLEESLEKSGIDYLMIASRPPTGAKKGNAYDYQLVVKSKKGGVNYRLASGASGMSISDTGKLSWTVPADFAETETSVIVSVRDAAGQEVFHTFRISIHN